VFFLLQCSEPFFLHPPPIQHQQPDGLYINPAHSSANDPFYLHNPHDLVYNRVKDLFETPSSSQPAAPTLSGLSGMPFLHKVFFFQNNNTAKIINLLITCIQGFQIMTL